MTIQPDAKDWTWVLQRPCRECAFDAASTAPALVGTLLRANAARWVAILNGDDMGVRRRPRPDVWSALEYGCHVRDVCILFEQRLELMLTQDDPLFANWDQDATALEQRYEAQDPSTVAKELAAAAGSLADGFDQVTGLQWERTGRRSDGAAFTVSSFARYMIHDPIHHLFDVASAGAA